MSSMLYTDIRINLPIPASYRQKRSGEVYLYKYTDSYYPEIYSLGKIPFRFLCANHPRAV